MQRAVIIVAGGSGSRMGASIPKQFIEIGGKPILMHTIERFYEYDKNIDIVVVLPSDQTSYWETICLEKRFHISHQVTQGGETRFHSVQNGLLLIEYADLIGVHDGVRPFVTQEVISQCYESAERLKAVIPVINAVDSIRQLTENGSIACERTLFKLVQTPQVFDSELLKNAYSQPFNEKFTDDASVVETCGNTVHLIEGNRENIKITTAFDLQLAKCLI